MNPPLNRDAMLIAVSSALTSVSRLAKSIIVSEPRSTSSIEAFCASGLIDRCNGNPITSSSNTRRSGAHRRILCALSVALMESLACRRVQERNAIPHAFPPAAASTLGFFAPYLDLDVRRSLTPAQS